MINEKLKKDLMALDIKNDDTVMVHSSLSALGYVEGGADSVIDTLSDILSDGTLLMPALSYRTVNKDNPTFSVKNTPSCVGLISETFRKREGVIRSMHPTHSVCGIGKYAQEILSQHINTSTPAGKKSPFALLPAYNGKILMLGCGLRPNTSIHAIEELVRPWYLLKEEMVPFELFDKNDIKYVKKYECHNFKGVAQMYDRLSTLMQFKAGNVLNAQCYLIDSAIMWEVAEKALKTDENFFIDIV